MSKIWDSFHVSSLQKIYLIVEILNQVGSRRLHFLLRLAMDLTDFKKLKIWYLKASNVFAPVVALHIQHTWKTAFYGQFYTGISLFHCINCIQREWIIEFSRFCCILDIAFIWVIIFSSLHDVHGSYKNNQRFSLLKIARQRVQKFCK